MVPISHVPKNCFSSNPFVRASARRSLFVDVARCSSKALSAISSNNLQRVGISDAPRRNSARMRFITVRATRLAAGENSSSANRCSSMNRTAGGNTRVHDCGSAVRARVLERCERGTRTYIGQTELLRR